MAYETILTNTGLQKLASATPEHQLKINRVAVGDGNGGYSPLDPDMTGLVNEVWRGPASAPIRDREDPTILIFEAVIPPNIGGFFIREVGIFDDTGDMIAIGQTAVTEKPQDTMGTALSLTIRFRMKLSNASETELIYNDQPPIDHEGLTNRDAPDSHPIGAITGLNNALSGKVDKSTFVFAGDGLAGGGSLGANITLSLSQATKDSLQKADESLQKSENLGDVEDKAQARQNLGLGTAATRDVTDSPADTTEGRVMKVGDGGLLSHSAGAVTSLAGIPTSIPRMSSKNFGIGGDVAGSAIVTKAGTDRAHALFMCGYPSFATRIFYKSTNDNWATDTGVIEFWTDANFNPGTAATKDVTTSVTDTTAGRVLQTGYLGIGGDFVVPYGTSLSSLPPGTHAYMPGDHSDAPPAADLMDGSLIVSGNAFRKTYIYQVFSPQRLFIKSSDAGSNWVEVSGGASQPTLTGAATFTSSSNTINLAGIAPALELEIGDVIQVSGSTSNNNLYTVEIINNDNSIVVNYEHRNGAGPLSLTNETANATIKRIAKWHSAPLGLGQAWVNVKDSRANNVVYTNTANRTIVANVHTNQGQVGENKILTISVDNLQIGRSDERATGVSDSTTTAIVPSGSTYIVEVLGWDFQNDVSWFELR